MLSPQELFWLYLNNIKNIGARRFAKLYFKYRTKEAFLEGIERGDQELIFLSAEILTEIKNGAWKTPCDRMINYMVEHAINAVFYSSPEYPPQLREIDAPPPILYYIGDFSFVQEPCIAIIGSRRATRYGRECAEKFSGTLAENGICVVSGMADGVDGYSHEAALACGGKTIAILGGGVDFIYPASNAALYRKIAENGLILSEYPLATRPQKENFPQRNRLIIGLSRCLLVVEAGMPSGTMITVDFAVEQNKSVFAVPGNITSPSSEGTNYLIKNGCLCALSPEDILMEFGIYKTEEKKKFKLPENVEPLQKQILEMLEIEDLPAEKIENSLQADINEINTALMMLEIAGYIKQFPGREYSLCR